MRQSQALLLLSEVEQALKVFGVQLLTLKNESRFWKRSLNSFIHWPNALRPRVIIKLLQLHVLALERRF